MVRPLAFDREQALEQAMKLFWRKGFSATSLAELLTEMNISRSSLYSSFGNKQHLFIEALNLFFDRTANILDQMIATNRPVVAIRRFFEHTLLEVDEHRQNRGCLMVNSILELTEVEPELAKHAARKLDLIETSFESCLNQAMLQDNYQNDSSSKQLAAYLMSVNQGLRVEVRKSNDMDRLKMVLETSLKSINL